MSLKKAHALPRYITHDSDFKIKLIHCVREEKCLYEKHSKEYRRRESKLKAWDRIAKKLGEDAFSCERRWIQLRERYSREKRKFEFSAAQNRGSLQKWEFMDHMSFLCEYVKTRSGDEKFFEYIEVGASKTSEDDDSMHDEAYSTTEDSYMKEELPDTDSNDTVVEDSIMEVLQLVKETKEDAAVQEEKEDAVVQEEKEDKEGKVDKEANEDKEDNRNDFKDKTEDDAFMKLAIMLMEPLPIVVKDRIRKNFMSTIFDERRKIFDKK